MPKLPILVAALIVAPFLMWVQHAHSQEVPFSWNRAVIYHIQTPLFNNGEPANDPDATPDGGQPGGDLAGLTAKIESGYFRDMGVDVLRLSSPWAQYFAVLERSAGTTSVFGHFMDTAHENGLKVLLDVRADLLCPLVEDVDCLVETDRGRGGADDEPDRVGSTIAETGRDLRIAGFDSIATSAIMHLDTSYTVPIVEPVATFFERTSLPRSVGSFAVKWLSDWVLNFGIDGITVPVNADLPVELINRLKSESTRALRLWKKSNPTKSRDTEDFRLIGITASGGTEIPVRKSKQPTLRDYSSYALDAVIRSDWPASAFAEMRSDSARAVYNRLKASSDGALPVLPSSVMNRTAGTTDFIRMGTAFFLLPGSIQFTFGDETARLMTTGAFQNDPMGPFMNWDSIDSSVFNHWQKLGTFRHRHPAVAEGDQIPLSESPDTFGRQVQIGRVVDRVVIVIGAEGRVRVSVSKIFPDDTVLRDACTGKIGIVSYGQISFTAGENGVLLLEELE